MIETNESASAFLQRTPGVVKEGALEICNARIERTCLGSDDSPCLTFFLHCTINAGSQAAGGYALDTPIKSDNGEFLTRRGTAAGMQLIQRVLHVVGARSWENLPGQYLRICHSHTKIYAIGHIIEDKWLDFHEFWSLREKEGDDNA